MWGVICGLRAMSQVDAYQVLGLERKLSLDREVIEAAFRAEGKRHHPDSGGDSDAFERVQEAGKRLLDPAARLRHWLELEDVPGEWRGQVTSGLMDVFSELGEVLQEADQLGRERGQASSALARAMLEGRTQACRERLEDAGARLDRMVAERVERFGVIEAGGCDGWEVARELGFLTKWRQQVRERFAGLW